MASTLAWFDEHPDSRELIEGAGWFACRRDAWPASSPFAFFAGIFCLNLDGATVRWSEATQRHAQLAIGGRVERFAGVATPDNPHRGIALSYRRMIAEAQRRGYAHLLVLEDDAVFLDETVTVMRTVVAELAELEWDLCYLGACVWTQSFPFVGDSTVLQACVRSRARTPSPSTRARTPVCWRISQPRSTTSTASFATTSRSTST